MPASTTDESLFAHYFEEVTDPRLDRRKQHSLLDIIGLTICAVICGADSFVAVERFGHAKRDWLDQYFVLPNGIPSHDTIGRTFALIDPREFEAGFRAWITAAFEQTEGQVVAIDGKTLRRSYDRQSSTASLQMVSAWASENHLSLGAAPVEADSNEVTAIPKLLELLELSGCIVTIDAAGCQTAITQQITDEQADYVLTLKANQGELYADVEALFRRLHEQGRLSAASACTSGGHGRVEVRRCWAVEVAGRGIVDTAAWSHLRSVAMVEAERHVEGKVTTERRFFISSLPADAERLLAAVRTHWHIENKLHWVLDVAFEEDASRIRKGHAAENMAVVRRLALSLLKQETTSPVGTATKRLQAGWNPEYLLSVLKGGI